MLLPGMSMTNATVTYLSRPTELPAGVWLGVLITCTLAGLAGAVWGWYLGLAPLALLMAAICLLHPEWGLYLLICALFFPYSPLASFNIYPADMFLFLIVIGFWMQRARQGKLGVIRTPLDLPIILWLGAMALSLVIAYDLPRGIINWLRHVQLFLLFYAVVGLADSRLSRRLLLLLIALSLIFACMNILPFIESGGTERVFGVARIPLSGTLTLVAVYLTAQTCLTTNRAKAAGYAFALVVILLGQISNQSRAALATIALGMIILFVFIWKWANVHAAKYPRQRILMFCIGGIGGLILISVMGVSVLTTLTERFAGKGNAATTLHYRYFMWNTAIRAFAANPILGIGLAQVQVWHHIFPDLRLDPIGFLTFGLGTHLSFFKYLAETGTIGAVSLLWFLQRLWRSAFRLIRRIDNVEQAGHLFGLSGVALIIILRSFVEGHFFYGIMGITNALFFGLLIRAVIDNILATSRALR